jgi:MFS family permease
MQEAMKVDITELNRAEAFGALMAVFLWVYGIVSPFAGLVADKVNRKWLVIGSLFVWSAVTMLMGFATSFNQLYILRGLMGISEALYIPSALSLLADWHTGKSRSLAIGVHMTGIYVGQAIGGFGAVAAAMFSWKETFHWFGVIGIAYSIVLLLLLHENPKHAQAATVETTTTKKKGAMFNEFIVVLSNWAFWIILFYFAAPSLPGWATKNWLPTLFAENLGIPMQNAGPMSTITIAASSFVGVLLGGYLSDKWVQRNLRGRIYTSAIGLGLTIPALILLGFGHSVVAVVGAGMLFGVGYGMFDANNMPILCQFVPANCRATAYGFMNMTGVFAGAAVTQVFGKWADGGQLGFGFAMLGGVVALALFLQLAFLKPKTDNME